MDGADPSATTTRLRKGCSIGETKDVGCAVRGLEFQEIAKVQSAWELHLVVNFANASVLQSMMVLHVDMGSHMSNSWN